MVARVGRNLALVVLDGFHVRQPGAPVSADFGGVGALSLECPGGTVPSAGTHLQVRCGRGRARTSDLRCQGHQARKPALGQLRRQRGLCGSGAHRRRSLVWVNGLCLEGELARAEDKRLRYTHFHTAGLLVYSARRTTLRIATVGPGADGLRSCHQWTAVTVMPDPFPRRRRVEELQVLRLRRGDRRWNRGQRRS